ncbi:MAG: 4-alpha-glucanotransferase [Methanotrichaceae archaeon]|nr:4-alpha-glucanotransferase [Methanotrichaceae archaeon]
MIIRGSGVLLHITSLPSPHGVGDLGEEAYRFADLLAQSGQSYWQVLPLSPADPFFGNTPYNSRSAFAGNPLLISLPSLVEDGLLSDADLQRPPHFPAGRVDYPSAISFKRYLFGQAYQNFKAQGDWSDYDAFCRDNAGWLDDYALFTSLRSMQRRRIWSSWPQELRDRDRTALERLENEQRERGNRVRFLQYLFFRQWFSLKRYCNRLGLKIIGDMPIYVNYDSADVWSRPEVFKLDEKKRPLVVSGVPPDLFSAGGQLWGNPIYRWDLLREEKFEWWMRRIGHNLRLFDLLRLDHFRGLVSYWEVPAREETAQRGTWVDAPHQEFFRALFRRFPSLPVIAEDLGFITPEVREVRRRFQIPGMKVLLFAFGPGLAKSPYAPHNITRNSVVYTGTHDNNTVRGWFEEESSADDRRRISSYVGHKVSADEVAWEFIRLAMGSVADTAILPLQDVLGLGSIARMNRPASTKGNYEWRMLPEQMRLNERLREMTEIFGRS